MTVKLIETLETSIYSPKHTKRTKIHFKLQKTEKERKQRCMLIFIALFILLRATLPN